MARHRQEKFVIVHRSAEPVKQSIGLVDEPKEFYRRVMDALLTILFFSFSLLYVP